MINSTLRYQKGLTLGRIFPSIPGFCACGCGQALFGRKAKWASESCRTNAYIQFAVLKGDNRIIREEIYKRDEGFCHNCGVFDENWQADHIVPVYKGGGACSLNNLQTLCLDCHKEKTE